MNKSSSNKTFVQTPHSSKANKDMIRMSNLMNTGTLEESKRGSNQSDKSAIQTGKAKLNDHFSRLTLKNQKGRKTEVPQNRDHLTSGFKR